MPAARTAFVAILIGLLYPIYTITGFDASAHTSEETCERAWTVPRGMLHSVFWSLRLRLLHGGLVHPRHARTAAAAKDGANAWFNLFANLPMPPMLHHLLAIGIVVANYICALAGMTSMSRMLFAFARDGGLPASNAICPRQPEAPHAGRRDLADGGALGGRHLLRAVHAGARRRLRAVPLRLLCHADRGGHDGGRQDVDRVRPVPPRRLVEAVRASSRSSAR